MKLSAHRFTLVLRAIAVALLAAASLRAQSNYATPYTFSTLAGNAGYGSSDGVGSEASFLEPRGIAVDSAGTIYVADCYNRTIRKITSGGMVTTLAGSAGQKGSANGTGSAARFMGPSAITVDGIGNLYVTDLESGAQIRKITRDGVVTTLAGSPNFMGSSDGPASVARFGSIHGIAVDGAGNLYIADSGTMTIRKLSSAGVVTTLAGKTGLSGVSDGIGDTARFTLPVGLALDSDGNLVVIDLNAIRKVTTTGVVTTIAGAVNVEGAADGMAGTARFSLPRSLSVDREGNIYVADQGNFTLRKISRDGVVTTVAGEVGVSGASDGLGVAAHFSGLNGVGVDNAGSLYIADPANTIRKMTLAGMVSTFAGMTGSRGSADGVGRAARFNGCLGLVTDREGNVYVADTENHTIRKITQAGLVTTLAGVASDQVYEAVDGVGSAARFLLPARLAIDQAGFLYVADGTSIRRVTSNGVVTTLAFTPTGAGSLAVDRVGNIYFADGAYTIRKLSVGGAITLVAGKPNSYGFADGIGSAARFGQTLSLALNRAGEIYVADTENYVIRKITSDGTVTTVAGQPGTRGSTDGFGINARFYKPMGIAVDGADNIFVADGWGFTLRRISGGGIVTTIGGVSDINGYADGTGNIARFYEGVSITAADDGTLYLSEYSNRTIRKGTPPLNPGFMAITSALTVSAGSTAVLNATVVPFLPTMTFQWRKDGAVLDGANTPTLVLSRAAAVQAGTYTCVAMTSEGGVAVSAPAMLTFSSTGDFGRLTNLSVLTSLSTSEGLFTVGTVIGGAGTSGTKPLLVRAAGPTLGAAPFNIPGTLPDPKLEIFSGPTSIASNNDWTGTAALSNAFTSVGAFPYVSTASKDAAYFNSALASGGYTVQVSDASGATGTVIAELYDATPAASFTATTPRLINVSVLKQIPSSGILTVGFVIGGSTAKSVLIRAVGPTLGAAPFNVGGVMADPQLTLFSGQTAIATNDNWGGDPQLTTAGNGVGAFALSGPTSKDAMLLITLPPGAYTAQATGVAGSAGQALVEVYEVP